MEREVYDSISLYFNDGAHFWLQYGSLEVEGRGRDLSLAENYLQLGADQELQDPILPSFT